MTPTIATHSALLTELAAVIAKGYFRLTRIAPDSATSCRKELDLRAEESPPVVDTEGHGGKEHAL